MTKSIVKILKQLKDQNDTALIVDEKSSELHKTRSQKQLTTIFPKIYGAAVEVLCETIEDMDNENELQDEK